MNVRAAGRASKRWTKQTVTVANPHIQSPAHLVLLARHYLSLDRSIYTEFRMNKVRNRWMKEQMKQIDPKGGLTCAICGKQGLKPHTADEKIRATLDHIVQLKDDGAWNNPTNFRVACFRCNTRRDQLQYRKKPKA